MSTAPPSAKLAASTQHGAARLPPLFQAAFKGDLASVHAALQRNDPVNDIIDLVNQNDQLVVGVTPLYLAAQQGHTEVVRRLIAAGACVLQQCCVPATGEVFSPADIAGLHFHFRTWWLLTQQRQADVSAGQRGASWAVQPPKKAASSGGPRSSANALSEPLLA